MPTHAEKRLLPFTPEQMFSLVADVAKYPEFLPWCTATRIRSEGGDELVADMVIGFKMFREKFTSRVHLSHPDRIDVVYEKGPFKYLNNHWKFRPHSGQNGEAHVEIDFYVDFEFHSAILQKVIGAVFNEAVQRMVNAFEQRAHALFD